MEATSVEGERGGTSASFARPAEVARQRLFRLGARALTDAELLSLVVGHHRVGSLLDAGLRALSREPLERLTEHRSLGEKGAARLLAAFELSHRASASSDPRPRLTSPRDIHDYARPHFTGLRREEMHALCLSSRNVLLRHVRVAEGAVDQCHVDPREVFGPAVAVRAAGLVLVHNHPSGDAEPSSQDVALTAQLRDAGKLLCIKLLDHLVLGDGGFTSLLARGLL